MQNHRPDRYPEHAGISQPGSCHSGGAAVLHGTRKRQKTANLGFGGAVSNRELLPLHLQKGQLALAQQLGPAHTASTHRAHPELGGELPFPNLTPPRAASSEAHGRSLPAASAGLGALGLLPRFFFGYPRFGCAAPGWRSLLPPSPRAPRCQHRGAARTPPPSCREISHSRDK